MAEHNHFMQNSAEIPETPNAEQRRRIMDFVMAAGTTMLENGAEVFRVEQTMEHMAKAFHLREFHVYVITNGIFASAGTAEHAEIRNVSTRGIHLGRVAAVNDLSRRITAGALSLPQAEIELVNAQRIACPPLVAQVLASGFGALCFGVLAGGSALDAVVSLLAGAGLGAYIYWCEQQKIDGMFRRLSGAAIVTLFCVLAGTLFARVDVSMAIIGAFMILTPGVAFTMAIRDFVKSDYLSGTIRLIDAVLIAASIACGTGLMLWLASLLGSGVAL